MARAIGRLISSDFQARCQEVAKLAKDENGLEIAAGWVEKLASGEATLPMR